MWNQSFSIIYPNEKNVFIVPNHEKKSRFLCESVFVQIHEWTIILKMAEKDAICMKPKPQIIYPDEKTAFMVPNHEKKEDDFVNPCLSKSTNEH